jgi:hypothetical protein
MADGVDTSLVTYVSTAFTTSIGATDIQLQFYQGSSALPIEEPVAVSKVLQLMVFTSEWSWGALPR